MNVHYVHYNLGFCNELKNGGNNFENLQWMFFSIFCLGSPPIASLNIERSLNLNIIKILLQYYYNIITISLLNQSINHNPQSGLACASINIWYNININSNNYIIITPWPLSLIIQIVWIILALFIIEIALTPWTICCFWNSVSRLQCLAQDDNHHLKNQ